MPPNDRAECNRVDRLFDEFDEALVQKLLALSEQNPDYTSVLELARSLREQVDWAEVRERTQHSPFAKGYFTLLEELEILPG